jgi:hypothetical protein
MPIDQTRHAGKPHWNYDSDEVEGDAIADLIGIGGDEIQVTSEKGVANGYASLDSSGLVPSTQLFGSDVRIRRTATEMLTFDDGAGGGIATVMAGTDAKLGLGTTPTHLRLTAIHVATNAPSGQLNMVGGSVIGKGTATVADRVHGTLMHCSDAASVVNKTITGAVNNGSGLIRITATSHTFVTGDKIAVYAVGGTTEANGAWTVTVIDANTFDLQGSTFTNAYTSGGTATNRPMMYGFFSVVAPTFDRGGLTGTAQFGDDVSNYAAYNGSATQAKSTDCFYIGHNTAFGAGQAEFFTGFNCDAYLQLSAFRFSGRITGAASSSCAIYDCVNAVIETDAFVMLAPNNGVFAARNAAGSANLPMFKLNTSNQLEITPTTKIVSGAGVIQLILGDVATDATNKVARFSGAHYTNSEEPIALVCASATSGSNSVLVGGGVGQCNAATDIIFYSATNNTTTAGTERFRIGGTTPAVTVADAVNIVVGTTTGTKYGTATTQKQAWWNATPVVQPTAVADAAGGGTIDAEARTALNALLARMRTIGLIAT